MSTAAELEARAKALAPIFKKNHRHFLGVFAADTLPDPVHARNAVDASVGDTSVLICNTAPADACDTRGHWIALAMPAREPAEFFDSYGSRSDRELVRLLTVGSTHVYRHFFDNWLHAAGYTRVFANGREYQSLESDVCGLYALWFCAVGDEGDNAGAWRPIMRHPTSPERDRVIANVVGLRTSWSPEKRDFWV